MWLRPARRGLPSLKEARAAESEELSRCLGGLSLATESGLGGLAGMVVMARVSPLHGRALTPGSRSAMLGRVVDPAATAGRALCVGAHVGGRRL